MTTFSPAELRDKLRAGLIDAGYLLSEDGTHLSESIVDGRYHSATIEGTSHPVMVARANFSTCRFVRTFNIRNETALERALAELGKTVKPSYLNN